MNVTSICSRCQLPTEAEQMLGDKCVECANVASTTSGASWDSSRCDPKADLLRACEEVHRNSQGLPAAISGTGDTFCSMVAGLREAGWDETPVHSVPLAELRRVQAEINAYSSVPLTSLDAVPR